MYKKKLVVTLMILLIIFLLVFLAAITALNKGTTVFGIRGFPPFVENWIVILFSILAIGRIVWEIILIEEHKR